MEKKKNKRFYLRLKNKFRMVVMNDDTFEEKFSMILSPLNVFTWGGFLLLLLVGLVSSMVAFTPLREYIPGYADMDIRKMATYAAWKADSLELELQRKEKHMQNIKDIISGKLPAEQEKAPAAESVIDSISLVPSREDSLLRKQIEKEDAYNLAIFDERKNGRQDNIVSYFFFTPLRGQVSASFNPEEGHYGVDIIAPRNEVVKATLDGTVILSTWTSETGHVIQLQHENNMISIYKHNAVLLKKMGEKVKAGEAVAIIGESGEFSSGPHLHFELWHNGTPIDPQEYMLF